MDSQILDHGGGLHGEARPDGTVRVSVDVSRPVAAVWDALTKPGQLACWFGTVDPPMQPGGRTRVDFGDGDFFDVSVVTMTEPVRVELDWSFLGVGTPHRVVWTAEEAPGGARIVVLDQDPQRPAEESSEMVSGWSDFLVRLRGYLETGKPTRYDWRGDLDGGVDLDEGAADPLSGEAVVRWLPVASDGSRPSWFFVVDSDGPRRFPVSGWSLDPGRRLVFDVALGEGGGGLTRCTVVVAASAKGRRLSFRQTGWRDAGLPVRRARALRSRFADSWREALRAASELNGSVTT